MAPAIAPDPENVSIRAANWFPLCDPPKWDGIARPATLLGQGAEIERSELLDAIVAKVPRAEAPSLGLHQRSSDSAGADGAHRRTERRKISPI